MDVLHGDLQDRQKEKSETTEIIPRFFTKEGKTYSRCKSRDLNGGKVVEFADFSSKIVGEIREGHNEALGVRNKEGRWLMSLTGYVFSKQVTR